MMERIRNSNEKFPPNEPTLLQSRLQFQTFAPPSNIQYLWFNIGVNILLKFFHLLQQNKMADNQANKQQQNDFLEDLIYREDSFSIEIDDDNDNNNQLHLEDGIPQNSDPLSSPSHHFQDDSYFQDPSNQWQFIENEQHYPYPKDPDWCTFECLDSSCQRCDLSTNIQTQENQIEFTKKQCQYQNASLQQQLSTPQSSQNPAGQKAKSSKENVETKNLPSFFMRQILNHLERVLNRDEQNENRHKWNRCIDRYKPKIQKASRKTLQDLLSESSIQQEVTSYLGSFEYLDDILSSEKQQDIGAPIKYLKKVYLGSINPKRFINWK